MTIVAFDTHKYVKRLTTAGMPESQAEVIADAQRSLIEDHLANKHDTNTLSDTIQDVKIALSQDIKEVGANIRRNFKETEQRLTIRFGIMFAVWTAVISALIKLL